LGDGVRLPAATSSAGTSTTSPLNTANIFNHTPDNQPSYQKIKTPHESY